MEEKKLYIPVAIRRKKEIADGIGKAEVIKIAILVVIGLVFGVIIFITSQQIYNMIIPPCIMLIFGIIFLRRDTTNKNVIDRIHEMLDFQKSQRRYMYRYYNIYEEVVNERTKKKGNGSKIINSK